jgi:hypothetical protein
VRAGGFVEADAFDDDAGAVASEGGVEHGRVGFDAGDGEILSSAASVHFFISGLPCA